MFPMSEAIVFSDKNTGFRSPSAIKPQWKLFLILGGAYFVAAGRMRLKCYDAGNGGSGEKWRKTI